jgi:hypothetical protein
MTADAVLGDARSKLPCWRKGRPSLSRPISHHVPFPVGVLRLGGQLDGGAQPVLPRFCAESWIFYGVG